MKRKGKAISFTIQSLLIIGVHLVKGQLDEDLTYAETEVAVNIQVVDETKADPNATNNDISKICPDKVTVDFNHRGESLTLHLCHNIDVKLDKIPVFTGNKSNFEKWPHIETSTSTCYYHDLSQHAAVTLQHDLGVFRMNGSFATVNGSFAIEPIGKRTPQMHRVYKIQSLTKDYSGDKLCNTKKPQKEASQEFLRPIHRHKRSTKTPIFIEILAVFDYGMYKSFYGGTDPMKTEKERKRDALHEVKYTAAHIFNLVDLMYKKIEDPQYRFTVYIKQIYIATDPSNAPYTESIKQSALPGDRDWVEASHVLTGFGEWLSTNERLLAGFDHATLITKYDLANVRSKSELGESYISEICTPEKKISIGEYAGIYRSAQIIAHELGHNLGAQHDGISNSCSPSDNYVMTPSVSEHQNLQNHGLFSPCSINYIIKHIEDMNSRNETCLLEESHEFNSTEYQLYLQDLQLGQKTFLDQQCQDLAGEPGSFFTGDLQDVCHKMGCRQTSTDSPYGQNKTILFRNAALDFTSCGPHKWCQDFVCVYDEKAPVLNISLDEQCKWATGDKDAIETKFLWDVCWGLLCYVPSEWTHKSFKNKVLDFTPCGINSWCVNSTCTEKNNDSFGEIETSTVGSTSKITTKTETTTTATTTTTTTATTTTTTATTTTTTVKKTTTTMDQPDYTTELVTKKRTSIIPSIQEKPIYTIQFDLPLEKPHCHNRSWMHHLKHKLASIHAVRHHRSSIHILHCRRHKPRSTVTYEIVDDQPFSEVELSLTAAELYNAIDTETQALIIARVPYHLDGYPRMLLGPNTAAEITSGCSILDHMGLCVCGRCELDGQDFPYCSDIKPTNGSIYHPRKSEEQHLNADLMKVLWPLLAGILLVIFVVAVIVGAVRYFKKQTASSELTPSRHRVKYKKLASDDNVEIGYTNYTKSPQ